MTDKDQYTIDNTPYRVKICEPEEGPRGDRLRKWNALKLNIDRDTTMWGIDDIGGCGKYPEELSRANHENVWAICIECGKGRLVMYKQYRDLCKSCSIHGRHHSEETRNKMSDSQSGDKCHMFGKRHSEESRVRMSCAHQGIGIDEFTGFLTNGTYGKYCSKFNESLKERIREKYGRKCLLCPTTEQENIEKYNRKLSIHHVDYNKQCGCDGNECRLVPLCDSCHSKTNNGRSYWEQVIMTKVVELFPNIKFDNPQTNLNDFCIPQSEHRTKLSNLVKSIVEQCVTYPPDKSTIKQSSLSNF